MAYRKNTKRIDPRYFLPETVNRNDDGSVLEEEDRSQRPIEWSLMGSQLTPREVAIRNYEIKFGRPWTEDDARQRPQHWERPQPGDHPGKTCEDAHRGDPHPEE